MLLRKLDLFLAGQPERPGAEAPPAGLREKHTQQEASKTLPGRKDRKSKREVVPQDR